MLLVIICCRVLKNVVLVAYGLNIACRNVSELVSSYSNFYGDIDNELERKNTVSVIEDD